MANHPSHPRPRAVLDTSALFSTHRHWLWLFAQLGYFEGVWSTFIVGELVRIRVERSISRGVERPVYRGRINQLVHLLSDVLSIADYRSVSTAGMLADPDDDPILAAALASRADVVVSLNRRDFPAGGGVAGVRFVSPHDFLSELVARFPGDDLTSRADEAGRRVP